MNTASTTKQGLLANAFSSHKWDSRIKSANTTAKEMWLGYVIGPYGMLIGQSIVNSYFNQYLTDILGFTVNKAAWIGTFMVLFPLVSKLLDAVTNLVMSKLIDMTACRQGKVRPWMIISAPLVAISMILMFWMPFSSPMAQAAWVVGSYNLYYCVAYTMELSADYLHAEKESAKSYPDLTPPFTREAPALFEANGKKYMLTSGMTGYVPNISDCAVADAWDAPFISIGNPHMDDESNASFNSQISKIFKVVGKDNLFIAMADRWLPATHVDARLADVFTRVIASNYAPDQYQATESERKEMYAVNVIGTADTSASEYVWLPIRFKNDKPVIEWIDTWTIEGE